MTTEHKGIDRHGVGTSTASELFIAVVSLVGHPLLLTQK